MTYSDLRPESVSEALTEGAPAMLRRTNFVTIRDLTGGRRREIIPALDNIGTLQCPTFSAMNNLTFPAN